jgi:ubiquinone/menaquinone biosynthesis C-methylase UbiE
LGKRQLKEDYYDEIYGRKGYEKKGGLVAWLYSHLKRYEENRYRTVFRLLERSGKLLDVGCGDGDFCIMAKGMFNDVYGVEVSQVRTLNAEKKINDRQDKGNFHFIQHDVDESLPFPDDFFDVATCIATLEYLVYPSRVILEVRRVLKPGGYFIVQVSNFAFLQYRFTLLIGKLPTPGGIDEVGVDWERLHNFTKQVIVTVLRRSKFEVISLTCSGIFARIRRILPSLLAADIIVKARKCKNEGKC